MRVAVFVLHMNDLDGIFIHTYVKGVGYEICQDLICIELTLGLFPQFDILGVGEVGF